MHFFSCEYDDLVQFEWPAILDQDTLQIWLDISCLKNKGFTFPNLHIKKIENFEYCEAHVLRSINQNNDFYKTILEQFLFFKLPIYFNDRLNELKLISVFDITDFWNEQKNINSIRKYWLLRFKIVTMLYENKKTKSESELIPENFKSQNSEKNLALINHKDTYNENNLVEDLINNVKLNFDNLQNYSKNKIYGLLQFNKLLKGSVGLLEILLDWNK